MQRQHPYLPRLAALALLVAAVSGCASVESMTAGFGKNDEATAETLLLTYKTDCARLIASGGGEGLVDTVSYTQDPMAFSQATVELISPHPAGRAGYAQVRVLFTDTLPEDSGLLVGTAPQAGESWVMDVPEARVTQLVEKLRADGFFRPSKILNANSFLATDIDGRQFGKECQGIPELDAVIVCVRQQGQREGGSPASPASGVALERMPGIY